MMFAHRDGLGRLKEAAGAVGQFFKVHTYPSVLPRMWCVMPLTQP
jgi:hypothetical protein